MPANFQRFDDSTNLDLPFDRVDVDLIVEFPRLNADRRIRYATCSWNKRARFHSLNQNRGRTETDYIERQFWKKKHAAALFPDGVHRHVHDGNVQRRQRLARVRPDELPGLWNQRR